MSEHARYQDVVRGRRAGLRPRLRRFKNPAQDQENQKTFRYFDFDVLLIKPAFCRRHKGQPHSVSVRLSQKDQNGTWEKAVGRDTLFIERNLQFLRPGGRAAIVLPRDGSTTQEMSASAAGIAERARIIAVVGLHGNTFKPHTGTKTSVLFLQDLERR